MTSIRFRLLWPPATQSVGSIMATPTARHNIDAGTVLPVAFQIPLSGMATTVDVPVSGVNWVWEFREEIYGGTTRYCSVPTSAEVLDYEDLPDIDPDTLNPTVETLTAWRAGREYAATIGDGIHSTFSVTHPLASTDICIDVINISTGQTAFPVVQRVANDTVYLDFGNTIPGVNSYRVLMQKVG